MDFGFGDSVVLITFVFDGTLVCALLEFGGLILSISDFGFMVFIARLFWLLYLGFEVWVCIVFGCFMGCCTWRLFLLLSFGFALLLLVVF